MIQRKIRGGDTITKPRHKLTALTAFCLSAATARAETAVEPGRYPVERRAACGNCHSPPDPGSVPLSRWTIVRAAFMVDARNITPGSRAASRSDAGPARAIRGGIRPDGPMTGPMIGPMIGPPMPIGLYRHLSDTDVNATVASLRTVPAAVAFLRSLPPLPGN